MFANLIPRFRRSSSSLSNSAFVRDVQIKQTIPRNRQSEFWLILGWILIAAKCAGTFWLVDHYSMPFNAWWIVGPTIVAAAGCTWIYLLRN